MGAMSQLYADTQKHRDEVSILHYELGRAARRMEMMAESVQKYCGKGGLSDLYFEWADETKKLMEDL